MMVQKIYLKRIDKKTYPHLRKEFPNANYMSSDLNYYRTISGAKRDIISKMRRRGYAKPIFEVMR